MTLPDYLEVLTLGGPEPASATTTVASRSGVRKIVVRNHVLLSDWNIDGVAYDLGPSADELFAAALGASIAEAILAAAATAALAVEELAVGTQLREGDVNPAPRVEISIVVTRVETDVVRALVDDAVRSARVVRHLRNGSDIELLPNVR